MTGNNMSVLVTLEMPTKPETLDEFLELMKGALVDTRNYAGCEKVETYVDQETKSIFLVEQWETAAHQQAYMGWRMETGFIDSVGPYLAGAPVARTFDIKADV
jgi:quinol monooxygenase YgiN